MLVIWGTPSNSYKQHHEQHHTQLDNAKRRTAISSIFLLLISLPFVVYFKVSTVRLIIITTLHLTDFAPFCAFQILGIFTLPKLYISNILILHEIDCFFAILCCNCAFPKLYEKERDIGRG